MLIPTVDRYMTRHPWTIRRDATINQAHALMREHGIRHLPVIDNDRIVGIVTVHDLHLIETLLDVNPDEVQVEDAMTTEVYIASPDDELADVVQRMAESKYGSAVVAKEHVVQGIFTSIDALEVLADFLRREAA